MRIYRLTVLAAFLGIAIGAWAQQPVGGVYNSSAPAPAAGTVVADQSDPAGNKLIAPGVVAKSMTAITSSNGTLNATFNVFSNSGAPDVLIQLDQTTTITAGAIKFQVTYDGSNFVDMSADAIIDPTSTTYATIAQPYTLQASTNKAFLLTMKGARGLQILMSTALTGTGSVTPYYSLLSYLPIHTVTAVQPSGSNLETAPVTTPTTTDTALRCTLISAASTNATNCKGSAGNVYGFRFVNTTTTVYYLRMYNASSAPTCSSGTGFIESIPIPPAGATGQAGGIVAIEPMGEGYTTGIGFCFTGGSSSSDNTNAATGVFGTILYK
jgi:hypothetical protein